jgi:DNA-directed RNA polymerase specialized sigma24 family protein
VASRAVRYLDTRRRQEPVSEYDLSQISNDFYYYDVELSGKADYLANYRLLFNDDILWALDSLNPGYRETLLLYLSGYKMREIADISYRCGSLPSRSEDTVKSRLYLARKQMQRLIDKGGKRRVYNRLII